MISISTITNDYCSNAMDEISSHVTSLSPVSHQNQLQNPLNISLRDAIMIMPDRTLDSIRPTMQDWNHFPLDSQLGVWSMENHRPRYHQRVPRQAGSNNDNDDDTSNTLLVAMLTEALALIDDLDE